MSIPVSLLIKACYDIAVSNTKSKGFHIYTNILIRVIKLINNFCFFVHFIFNTTGLIALSLDVD